MEETFNPNERSLTAPLTLEYIKDNGGCTLKIAFPHFEIVDFKTHRQAYSIAIFHGDDLRISNYLLCDDELLHLIIEAFTRWARRQSIFSYFGAWVDGDDLVLDASRVSYDLEIAMEIAEELDQYAIFDLINFEVIPCGGDE